MRREGTNNDFAWRGGACAKEWSEGRREGEGGAILVCWAAHTFKKERACVRACGRHTQQKHKATRDIDLG